MSTFESLWQAVGLEVTIFLVTLVVALIIRAGPGLRQGEPAAKQAKQVSEQLSPVPVQVRPATPSRATTPPSPQARSVMSEKARPPQRDPAHVIDEVVDAMREAPGMKSAGRALSTYANDLQPTLREARIMEVTRRTKHSAIDFYTVLVHCAIRVGKYHLIDGIIDDMIGQGVGRPLAFYESAMKQLAGQKHYHFALSMYDRLEGDGLEPSAVTCSCLISFAAEVGELNRAIAFFEKLASITKPSIRAYMTVLRVHAKRQDWASSQSILRDMQQRRVGIDSLALNVALATGVAANQLEAVEALIVEIDGHGAPVSDVVSYNTLLKGYAQHNDASSAISVIRRMRERKLMPNAISYNTAMDAAVRSSRSQDAWDLLEEMRASKLHPDKFTCSILVKGLSRGPTSTQIGKCIELLRDVDATCDVTLKSTLYHAVLEAAAQVPDTSMLMQTFTQMRSRHVSPTAAAYRQLVQALGQEGDVTRFGCLWQQMLSEDARPQGAVFMALVDSHLKQGQMDAALAAFDSLRTSLRSSGSGKGRPRDGGQLLEECRAAFIRSLCRISREQEATFIYLQARADGSLAEIDSATGMLLARLQADVNNLPQSWATLEDMLSLGHQPNEVALHAFLSACTRQSHTLYAKALLRKAISSELSLSQATYVLLLKLYGRTQQLQDALAVFADMTMRQRIEPSPQTVVSLLRVCFQCRQPEHAEEIVQRLQVQAGGPLDLAIYRAMIGGYVTAGPVSKAVAVAEDAAQCGVSLPLDALELISAAVTRRGASGEADQQRLQQLASAQGYALGAQSPGLVQRAAKSCPDF